ncbi:fusaridione A cluster transcription factor fsdR [Colletotrichum spaethianum]|uniref:Fusaridione A cluster transcription factor fsdR n=1 Tax=Colletotrichum spaethianum TaxID=700344 RepID=A0AA37PBF4_9PEZI|nr:fusaridione A cluster transcription factor fsdR [Colletotrichum spaethianum]GKT49090.1 fusaridione A cluster transcription factor fsdR [Colletotrichum spaethianum]
MECMSDFFLTLNHDIKVFEETEVRAAVQSYIYGQPPPGSGWKMALNVILLHSLRKRDWTNQTGEYEKYLHNALGLIPIAILQTPDPLTIGALLSLTTYFVFTAENHVALSILAIAVQFVLLAGYHHSDHPTLTPAETLHRRRLFWQAYVLDHDLMLRIGKPPLITDDFLLDIPEEYPQDGYGMFFYPGDVILNYFRQQVRLSQIQGQICSRLYFRSGRAASTSTLDGEIASLDAELQEWRDSIPEMIRPEPSSGLIDADYSRMMSLSVLHFVYFQLVVAVHSAAFRVLDQDVESLRPSVGICVNAARGAISLLNYHQLQHPFTIYLLYQVAWCVDILFVNILENKTSAQSLQDLELIKMVLKFFEGYDMNHQRVASYHIIKALYEVASSVVGGARPGLTDAATLPELPRSSVGMSVGGSSDLVDSMPTLSMSDIDLDGWEEISLGSHDWLSAGFLQMADWGPPMNSGTKLEQPDEEFGLT